MATAIDDVRPGEYLMLSGKDEPEEYDPFGSSWMMLRPAKRRNHGMTPCRVLAVSPPFLAVEMRGQRVSIDARDYELLRVSRRFVESLDEQKPIPSVGKKRRRKEKPDPRCCIRCGTRLVQRLVYVIERAQWLPTCKQCGWQGDPAKT